MTQKIVLLILFAIFLNECTTDKQTSDSIPFIDVRRNYPEKEIVLTSELKRNANTKGKYYFEYDQDMASVRKERMKKPRKLHPWLKKEIIELIKQDWSPQQIEGSLKLENKPAVSHQTIYQIIRQDRADGGIMYKHTRHKL